MGTPFLCPSGRWDTKDDEFEPVRRMPRNCKDAAYSYKVIVSKDGSSAGDSPVLRVSVNLDSLMKLFGDFRMLSIDLHPRDGIRVSDMDHLKSWIRDRDIHTEEELCAHFPEYKKEFPTKIIYGPDVVIRLSDTHIKPARRAKQSRSKK